MQTWKYYLPGSIVIAMGVLIVAIPEILIAIAASAIIMMGLLALYMGHLMRDSDRRLRNFNHQIWVDDGYGEAFFNIFRVKWWLQKF